jgi:pentatricopeptide repeat protein
MLAELEARRCTINAFARNKALAACMGRENSDSARLGFAEALAKVADLDAVGYNTLMKLYAKAGNLDHCFKLRAEMTQQGVKPSEVTFGILLNACVGAGYFDRARDIFAELCNSGVRLNVVHCTTFIKGLISAERLHEADDVLNEMSRSPGTKPDLITYSILVKAYADHGDVSAAFTVLKRMLDEDIKPDEIIFNSVLGSCSVGPAEVSQSLSVFNSLLELGLKPSTLTLSILLKALLLRKAWGCAIDLLTECPRRFGLEPETRLYMQIVQASIKASDGEAAIKAFQALQDGAARRDETLDPMTYSRLLRQCANTFDNQTTTKIRSLGKFPRPPFQASTAKPAREELRAKCM